MENERKGKYDITIPDRYSDKYFTTNLFDVFLTGTKVWTIRKSNPECVDLRDNSGKLLNWYSLEYVLKNPDMFKRISICPSIGTGNRLKIIQKPFSITPSPNLAIKLK